MKESSETHKSEMDDPEFRHAYARAIMNSSIAAQIKVIREQRDMTQAGLAEAVGTKQAGISRLENVNYDAWKVATLSKIAEAYDVWLKITFEEFSTLEPEIESHNRAGLQRDSYEEGKKRARSPQEMIQVVNDFLSVAWTGTGSPRSLFGTTVPTGTYDIVRPQQSSVASLDAIRVAEEDVYAK